MAVPEFPWDFTTNFFNNHELVSPVIRTTLVPSYYRGCCNKLGTFYSGTVIFFPTKELYNPKVSSLTPSLHQVSPLCKIPTAASVEFGPCLVPMWLIISKSAIDKACEPLLHQQTNQVRHPLA